MYTSFTSGFRLSWQCRFKVNHDSQASVVNDPASDQSSRCRLYNVPDVFSGVAKLATGDTGTETEVADADSVVFESVCKIVVTFSHSADENTDALP